MGHGAWGMGHGAWGMGHGAWGMGHGAIEIFTYSLMTYAATPYIAVMVRLDPRTQQILIEMILAIANLDGKRCSQLTLDLAESTTPVNLTYLQNDFDRLLRRYYNLNLAEINFSQLTYQILQIAHKHEIRLPSNMGLYAKTLANLEGVTRQLNPDFNLIEQIKPLMADLFRQRLVDYAPLQDFLRSDLDVPLCRQKSLELDQIEQSQKN